MRPDELEDKLGAHGDLNALNGVEENNTEPAVKTVTAPNLVEGGARGKIICEISSGIALTKGVEIATQAVVVDGLEAIDQVQSSNASKPTCQKEIGLVFEGQRWFGVDHVVTSKPERGESGQKRATELRMQAEARRL